MFRTMGPCRFESSTSALLVTMRPSLEMTKPVPGPLFHLGLPSTASRTLDGDAHHPGTRTCLRSGRPSSCTGPGCLRVSERKHRRAPAPRGPLMREHCDRRDQQRSAAPERASRAAARAASGASAAGPPVRLARPARNGPRRRRRRGARPARRRARGSGSVGSSSSSSSSKRPAASGHLQGGAVVEGEDLGEVFGADGGRSSSQRARRGVLGRPVGERELGVGDVADQGVDEDELGLALDRGGALRTHELLGDQVVEALEDLGELMRAHGGDRSGPEAATDDGGVGEQRLALRPTAGRGGRRSARRSSRAAGPGRPA